MKSTISVVLIVLLLAFSLTACEKEEVVTEQAVSATSVEQEQAPAVEGNAAEEEAVREEGQVPAGEEQAAGEEGQVPAGEKEAPAVPAEQK